MLLVNGIGLWKVTKLRRPKSPRISKGTSRIWRSWRI